MDSRLTDVNTSIRSHYSDFIMVIVTALGHIYSTTSRRGKNYRKSCVIILCVERVRSTPVCRSFNLVCLSTRPDC
jgi:hypothetical protein